MNISRFIKHLTIRRKSGYSQCEEIYALEAGERLCTGEQHRSGLSTAWLFGLNESQITLKCIEEAQFKSGCWKGNEIVRKGRKRDLRLPINTCNNVHTNT